MKSGDLMVRKIAIFNFLALLLIVLIAGCGSKQSEQELFDIAEKAQESGKPMDAIRAYRNLIAEHPNSEHCPKALFMIGFIYAEQYGDSTRALEVFEEFVDTYPDNELASSAEFMVQSMRGEIPDPVSSED